MDSTHQSADSARCAAHKANSAVVTYVLNRLLAQYGKLGDAAPMHGFLSYGSLKDVSSGSAATEIQPLSKWALLPVSQALPKAILDIRTSGEPVILCFANTSWRLLIGCRTVMMPSFAAGVSFASLAMTSTHALLARLYAQPQEQAQPCSALRAWHAVVPGADDEAMLLFLSTALHQSLQISIAPSAASLSGLLSDTNEDCGPDDDHFNYPEDEP